nr:hypothetical protein [Tanacetum cinerariifolium]
CVEYYPQHPGDHENQTNAAQRFTDGSSQAVALGKLEQRKAPDLAQDLDEGDRQNNPRQPVGQIQQPRLVDMPTTPFNGRGFEQVLEDRTQ